MHGAAELHRGYAWVEGSCEEIQIWGCGLIGGALGVSLAGRIERLGVFMFAEAFSLGAAIKDYQRSIMACKTPALLEHWVSPLGCAGALMARKTIDATTNRCPPRSGVFALRAHAKSPRRCTSIAMLGLEMPCVVSCTASVPSLGEVDDQFHGQVQEGLGAGDILLPQTSARSDRLEGPFAFSGPMCASFAALFPGPGAMLLD